MGTELAVRNDLIVSLDDIQRLSKMFLATGFIKVERPGDAQQGIAELATKILAGREAGFEPFASVTGISIIKGRPTFGGNLFATAVKKSGKYDYRIREKTDKACTIEFFQLYGSKYESIHIETFTAEEARRAGTQNMDKFPKNMLFNRCISNGVKACCPDVFLGVTVYTPEEMGAQVDENGDYVEVTARTVDQDTGEIFDTPAPVIAPSIEPAPTDEPEKITDRSMKQMHAIGIKLYGKDGWSQKRAEIVAHLTKQQYTSANYLTEAQARQIIEGMDKKLKDAAQQLVNGTPEPFSQDEVTALDPEAMFA
jgi:hypothetical protein